MGLFEKITHVVARDCFEDEGTLFFVVQPGQIGKAVGKKASNVSSIERLLNRKIKILEFNPEVVGYIKNVIFPLKVEDVTFEEGIATIISGDSKTRGLLIGRAAQKLRQFEKIVQREFENLKEIKVI